MSPLDIVSIYWPGSLRSVDYQLQLTKPRKPPREDHGERSAPWRLRKPPGEGRTYLSQQVRRSFL
jgi:hypothetical protein